AGAAARPEPAATVAPKQRSPSYPAPPAKESAEGEPITMPFGELTVSEGKIVRWVQPEGASLRQGELVAEIETDKAVVEIESPCAGVLAQIEHPVGAVVRMGERIGVVRQT